MILITRPGFGRFSYRIVSQSAPEDPVAGEIGNDQAFNVDLEALNCKPPYDVTLSFFGSNSMVATGVSSNDVVAFYWWTENEKGGMPKSPAILELVNEP